ncbi:universal stress protein [Streptomyces sp. NPDC096040]|uniref:universal stress protein n=1 Tax=Streptomyces sp. NPDC096040 TaxID=3155541 RepID=UPI00332CCBB7
MRPGGAGAVGEVGHTDRDAPVPRVVVGVDGSPASYAALRWAVRYAGLVGGTVEAIAAWELQGLQSWSGPAADMDIDEDDTRQDAAGADRGAGPGHRRLGHRASGARQRRGHPAAGRARRRGAGRRQQGVAGSPAPCSGP